MSDYDYCPNSQIPYDWQRMVKKDKQSAPIDWQARYQAREQQLKILVDSWAEEHHALAGISAMAIAYRTCAQQLRALLSEEPTV